jgi:hypothetical protein
MYSTVPVTKKNAEICPHDYILIPVSLCSLFV